MERKYPKTESIQRTELILYITWGAFLLLLIITNLVNPSATMWFLIISSFAGFIFSLSKIIKLERVFFLRVAQQGYSSEFPPYFEHCYHDKGTQASVRNYLSSNKYLELGNEDIVAQGNILRRTKAFVDWKLIMLGVSALGIVGVIRWLQG